MARRPAIFPSAFHPHVGGVEELTRQLALEQTRRGMHPLIVTNQWPRSLPEADLVDDLTVRRLPFRTPGYRPRQLIGWAVWGAKTHEQTARTLKEWGADVVHIQCVSNNAPFAVRASRGLGLPLVVSAHGELSMDANHLFERSAIARSILRRALASADVITGCSRYVISELDRFSNGQYFQKMRVIYNGIDLKECARAIPEPRARPYVLGLGRLVPQKGYDLLIRAFQLLASDFPNHELVIAGDGPQSAQLHDLVVSLALESRVQFLGTVDHRTALSLMAGAAVFALCSPHEPQGIVILEAMAVGSPVVASASGGVPEVVDDSNGLLFPVGNYRELACKLREVLSDDAMAAELSLAGRTTAAQFSLKAVASEYQSAYQDAGA
jgi:glycosyltransferase involved in cell wall biosynthesis